MPAFENITFAKHIQSSADERQQKRYDAYFAHLLGHTDTPPDRFRHDARPARERAMFQSYIQRRGLVIGRAVKR